MKDRCDNCGRFVPDEFHGDLAGDSFEDTDGVPVVRINACGCGQRWNREPRQTAWGLIIVRVVTRYGWFPAVPPEFRT